MRHWILCCLGLLTSTLLCAQGDSKQYNSLLWKITGNGLSKPSYLYGTMHLTDKRLFYFGDSLYKALEQTEGFAAELDMSTFASQYLNFMFNDERGNMLLSDILNDQRLGPYREKLEKKFGKTADKITAKEIDEEDSRQKQKLLEKGEMKTFMDAYLFDIALKQGKWTGGIEDIEDQLTLINDEMEEKLDNIFTSKEKTDKTIEWMINVYLKQDLDLIDRTDEIWRGEKDRILLKRNVKMARRMDSLANIRSCLFAVGAAHLPGDSGVVSLLRNKGFTVTPVTASRTVAPEKYTYKIVERPWLNVVTRDSLYTLQMPGKAEPFSIFESGGIEFKMYFDMGNMLAYMTMAMPMGSVAANKKDSMLNLIAERYKKRNSDFTIKDVVIGNEKGKEFTMKDESGQYRMQAFVPGNFLVVNCIFASKKEGTTSADARRFFESFKSNNRPGRPVATTGEKWQRYNFPNFAFSIEMPGKYSEKKNKTEENWNERTYEIMDIPGNAYYGVVAAETTAGYYYNSDTSYFTQTEENLLSKMDAKKISSRRFDIKGFSAFESIIQAGDKYENAYLRILLVNRGNRRYFLISSYIADKKDMVDRFFSSFELIPLAEAKWRKETAPDKSFQLWSPSTITATEISTPTRTQYIIYDSAGAVSVNVEKNVLPPYYWVENDSTMFRQRINIFITYNDSLAEYKKIQSGSLKGVDALIRSEGTSIMKRLRMFLSGDTLYTLYGFIPDESLKTANYERLFGEFHVTAETPPANFAARKPEMLLTALRTEDSTAFARAREVFGIVSFEKEDLPLLQNALLYLYRDFDSDYYSSTNAVISQKVIDLDSDYTSVSFIKNNYDHIAAANERAKPFLLSVLSRIETAESYDLLKELMVKKAPKINEEYYFNNRLYDSLKLTRRLFPDVLSRINDPGLSGMVMGLASSLIEEELLTKKDLLPYKDLIVSVAKKELARPKEEMEEKAYKYLDFLPLLGELNLPETNVLLNRFGKMTDRSVRMRVVVALLKNNQLVDRREIYTLASTDQYRGQLYEELKKLKKQNLFPIDFLSQKHIGQSKLYDNASDDDASPLAINYMGERTEMFMGKLQKFYLYRVEYDALDEESMYLGVAGPYPLDKKDLNSSHDATGILYDEKFNPNQIDILFKEYLAQIEKNLKEEPRK